ncbi:MAG: EthD domain-containing protein [Cellvibrionales bacterium]|jgi:uncharacterized protein (TIGR02118 family)
MIKVITLLTRKVGMTHEAFRERYENGHRQIGEKYLGGEAVRYVRRYVNTSDPAAQYGKQPDFDVVMEIWFPDRGAMERAMAALGTPDAQAEIIEDEEALFDRSRIITFIVDEVESTM